MSLLDSERSPVNVDVSVYQATDLVTEWTNHMVIVPPFMGQNFRPRTDSGHVCVKLVMPCLPNGLPSPQYIQVVFCT